MVHQLGSAGSVELHLDQVDPARRAAGERARGAAEARERVAPAAHARTEARSGASGLDLDHDQGFALTEDEIDLGQARLQAPREEAPALCAQLALDQAFTGQREGRIACRQPPQRETRSQPSQQTGERAPQPGPQALLGSARSSSAASFSCSTTLWTAAREKRMRTLSATCSTTISLVVVTTLP